VGNQQNVVMGLSMGGLVARIALRQMELDGVNHQTWKYISVDTPHKGANVPVGFQTAIRHLKNFNFWILFQSINYQTLGLSMVADANNLLNSMAAKQMLVYNTTQFYFLDNSVHNAFQQTYDQLGFPQQCQNVCIANGSNNGTLNFPPGSPIIDYQLSIPLSWLPPFLVGILTLISDNPLIGLVNLLPGSSQFRVEYNIDALKNQTVSRIYKGKVYIRKKIFWIIPVNTSITDVTVSSTGLPLDGAPGGQYSLSMLSSDLPFPSSAIKQSKFCFVPTVSALALSNWETKLTQNLNGIATPFNDVFTQGANELHTRFNSSAAFLYSHLIPPISGPATICATATYTLSNNAPATWSVAPSGAFSITAQNGTSATVTALTLDGQAGTLTAVLAGGATVTKAIQTCQPTIVGPNTVGCKAEQFYIFGFPSEAGSITWSVGPGLGILGDVNAANVWVRGCASASPSSVAVTFTYNGSTYSVAKDIIGVSATTVTSLSIQIVNSWQEGNTKCFLLQARDGQGNEITGELCPLWCANNGALYSTTGEAIDCIWTRGIDEGRGINNEGTNSKGLNDYPDGSDDPNNPDYPDNPDPEEPMQGFDPRSVILKLLPDFAGNYMASVTCSYYRACSNTIAADLVIAPFAITGPNMISCKSVQFSLSPLAGNIRWSVGPGLNIMSGQGSSTVSIKGTSMTSATTISATYTYGGSTFTISKPLSVHVSNTLTGLSLQLIGSWVEKNSVCYLIYVADNLGHYIQGDEPCYYRWHTTNGTIGTNCDLEDPGDTEYPVDPPGDPGDLEDPGNLDDPGKSRGGKDLPDEPYDPGLEVPNDPRYVILRGPYSWPVTAHVWCSYSNSCGTITSSTLTIGGRSGSENDASDNTALYAVYPNPASSTLHFEVNANATRQGGIQGQQGNCRVQLISIMSATLGLEQKVANFSNNFDINVNDVPDGLYLLVLWQGNEVVQQQNILVQH
jgi:hypothetical protein